MTSPTVAAGSYRWLDSVHPIYTASADLWRENERRLRGGKPAVEGELLAFDWEQTGDGAKALEARRKLAHYENLPEEFCDLIVGHLMRSAPAPDHGLVFGSLGEVRSRERVTQPSEAELIYYNVDGTGSDGAQWDSFWAREMRFAMATGHRWLMADAPARAPRTLADEMRGLRPYLRGFSPLAVTDWYFDAEGLAYAILRLLRRRPTVLAGTMVGVDTQPGYLLLVRQGYMALGPEFAGGGWWRFDSRKDPIPEERGTWASTGGQIPFWPLFYQRDNQDGQYDLASGMQLAPPAMSRPAITELGQLAVVLLNITSAQRFDAWDAAKSVTWFLGAEKSAFNLAIDKMKEGSRYVPLPQSPGADGSRGGLAISDSAAGAVPSQVFRTVLEGLTAAADRAALREAAGAPQSSGVSKQATFAHRLGARLADVASELETSQNTGLYFLARRFGKAPDGEVHWPRKFDLLELIDRILQFFGAEQLATVKSPTADATALVQLVKDLGIAEDQATLATISGEYADDAKQQQEQRAQLRTAMAALGAPNGAPSGTPGDTAGNGKPRTAPAVPVPTPKPGEGVTT